MAVYVFARGQFSWEGRHPQFKDRQKHHERSGLKKEKFKLCLSARVGVREDVQEAERRQWFVFSRNNSDFPSDFGILFFTCSMCKDISDVRRILDMAVY